MCCHANRVREAIDVSTQVLMNLWSLFMTLFLAIHDLRHQTIPNQGLLLLLVPALVVGISSFGFFWAFDALLRSLGLLVILLPIFVSKILGAGDIKLLVLLLAITGFPTFCGIVYASLLSGGLIGIVYLWIFKCRLIDENRSVQADTTRLDSEPQGSDAAFSSQRPVMPFGPAIFLGFLFEVAGHEEVTEILCWARGFKASLPFWSQA